MCFSANVGRHLLKSNCILGASFARIFINFAQIFRDFARIFNKLILLWVRVHIMRCRLLHNCSYHLQEILTRVKR